MVVYSIHKSTKLSVHVLGHLDKFQLFLKYLSLNTSKYLEVWAHKILLYGCSNYGLLQHSAIIVLRKSFLSTCLLYSHRCSFKLSVAQQWGSSVLFVLTFWQRHFDGRLFPAGRLLHGNGHSQNSLQHRDCHPVFWRGFAPEAVCLSSQKLANKSAIGPSPDGFRLYR